MGERVDASASHPTSSTLPGFVIPDPSHSKRKNHARKPDRSNRAMEAVANHLARMRAVQEQASNVRQTAAGRVAKPKANHKVPQAAARTALEERRERPPRQAPRKLWQFDIAGGGREQESVTRKPTQARAVKRTAFAAPSSAYNSAARPPVHKTGPLAAKANPGKGNKRERRTGPSSQAPSALPHRLKAPQRLPQAAPSAPQGPHPQAEDDKPLKYDFGPTQTRDDAGTSDQPKYFTRPQDGVKLKHGGPCPICLVEWAPAWRQVELVGKAVCNKHAIWCGRHPCGKLHNDEVAIAHLMESTGRSHRDAARSLFGDGKLTPKELQQRNGTASSSNPEVGTVTAPLQPLQHSVARDPVGHSSTPSAAASVQPVQPILNPVQGLSPAASLQPLQHEGASDAAGGMQLVQNMDWPASRKRSRDALEKEDDDQAGRKRFHIQAYVGAKPAQK